MATSTKDKDLKALQRILSQAEMVLDTIPNPHPSMVRLRELLSAAGALSKDLANRPPEAVALGAIGGKKTAQRMTAKDPEYYAKIAGMRKTKAGGRPKKDR